LLTYEDYLNEGEVDARYDIIDGQRIFMANPCAEHQDVQFNITTIFHMYQRSSRKGRMLSAPCDVLIARSPLRTWQPDVLFISKERWGCRNRSDTSPIDPVPELVVEVLSPGERRRSHLGRIMDYCSVDVKEYWMVSPQAETIEVLRLTLDGPETVRIYGHEEVVRSIIFEDLMSPVADIFAQY
jgi:Uma2 family endonuclease